MTHRFRFCALLFIPVFSLWAEPSLSADKQLPIVKYTVHDGLSNNQINCILKGSKGFLWIGTNDGLNRFDGKHFKSFRNEPGNENSLPGNIVQSLSEDLDGNLWVSTPQGVCYYNLTTRKVSRLAQPYPKNDSLFMKRHVFCDSQDRVWFNNHEGIVCYNRNTSISRQYKLDGIGATMEIFQFYESLQKNVWVVTIDGLFSFNEATKRFEHINKERSKISSGFIPRCITQSNDNRFYIGLWGDGVANFTERELVLTERSISTTIWAISPGPDETTLLCSGTTPGVYYLNMDSHDMELYHLFNKTTRQKEETLIHFIYKDDLGIIWFGSEVGLLKYTPSYTRFQSVDFTSHGIQLHGDVPQDIFSDKVDVNQVWFHVWTAGIFNYNIATATLVLFKQNAENPQLKLPGAYVSMLTSGPDGTVWAGISGQGLYKFDRITKSFVDAFPYGAPTDLINNNCGSAAFGASDTMYVLARGRGFFKYHPPSGYYKEYLSKSIEYGNISLEFVFKIEHSKSGDLFFASRDKGMYKFDHVNQLFSLYHAGSNGKRYPTSYTRDLIKDNQGNLWAATLEGLVKINSANIIEHIYTQFDGLPTNILWGLDFSKSGDLILSTDQGLVKFNIENEHFNIAVSDLGFFSKNESSICMLHNGSIAVGYQDRLYIIEDNLHQKKAKSTPLVLNSLTINGSEAPFEPTHNYVFKPRQNNFSLHFSLLDYETNQPVTYQYKFGNSSDWIDMDSRSDLTFSNLGAGSYSLWVRARSKQNSEWISISNPILLTVLPPFYNTWWFTLLVIAVVSGMLYWLYRLRINRIIELERVRSNISRDLHDEIGSTLSSINILTRSAKKRFEEKDELRLSDSLEKISTRTQRILDSMSDIIWSVKPENDHLDNVLARMREYASTLLEAKRIHFTINFPEDAHYLKLPLATKNNIFLIYKEAINNAVKYAECSSVEIKLTVNRNTLILIIQDNGIGFDPKTNNHTMTGGNGLANMKSRAKEMKASLTITSNVGKGTLLMLEKVL